MLMKKNVNSYMYLDLKGLFPDASTQSTLSRFLDFLRLDETLFNIDSGALRSNHEMCLIGLLVLDTMGRINIKINNNRINYAVKPSK